MYNMPTRVVFAQVHKSTEAVEASDAHVYELYQSSNEVEVTISDFEAAFYNNTGSFRIECQNIEDSGIPFKLSLWQTLGDESNVEVANVVLADWENDLGVETACWSTCSLMNVREQLLSADDLCKLKCNVSCCLSKEELIAALNQANGTSNENFVGGELVTLSVLLSNGNPSAKPVEFRLNFVIATPAP